MKRLTYFKFHSKTVKFSMDMQKAPYCDGLISKKSEMDQFYVGTDLKFLIFMSGVFFENPCQ